MVSRFLGDLAIADVVTLGNAIIGFVAIVIASSDPGLAARLILLAAVADGLDGVLARRFGGSPVGPYLDSLADVASFGVAPAVLVYAIVRGATLPGVPDPVAPIAVAVVPAAFVALAILRLGVYSAYDVRETRTVGAPSTLAATILAAATLTLRTNQPLVLGGTAILALAMISPVRYPDLLARDAVLMGVIAAFAVLRPSFFGRVFPYALLTLAVAYLLIAPIFYWGESERRLRDATN